MQGTRDLLASPVGRGVAFGLGILAAATLIGLAALWPQGDDGTAPQLVAGSTQQARVVNVSRARCAELDGPRCRTLQVQLLDGPEKNRLVFVNLPSVEASPPVDGGDRIRVLRVSSSGLDPQLEARTAQGGSAEKPVYAFVDFERRAPMLWLALLFAGLVVVLGRWHGVRSLVGLVLSLGVVLAFMVPAILGGSPALLVALVGGLAVMFATILLVHGLGTKSAAALLGTAASLLATALLALVFVRLANVTGFSSEEATLLSSGSDGALSLQGFVLAGMVVGTLGVLDDVTVSQSSTVIELRRADPDQPVRELFGRALNVGRDHLSATVNTLVLAYAGASLPLLLVFHTQSTSFGDAINRDAVAAQVIGMLVGSIGLMLAVPITTALAALLTARLPVEPLPADAHAPAH